MLYRKLVASWLCLCLLSPSSTAFAASGSTAPSSAMGLAGLSPRIGYANEYWRGNNGKTVYLIRDAHDSVEAQKNIARIIQYLVAHEKVKTVYEEGYEGDVPTDLFFQDIKDSSIREKVSRQLLEELRIGGAEYAHINRRKQVRSLKLEVRSENNLPTSNIQLPTQTDFKLIGADSLRGHLENIFEYRRAARLREEILSDLSAIEKEQALIVAKKFPPSARQWMKLKERFENQQLDLAGYLKRSVSIYLNLKNQDAFTRQYPQLTVFVKALDSKNAEMIRGARQIQGRVFSHELRTFEKELSAALLNQPLLGRVFSDYQTVKLARKLALMELSPSDFADVQTLLGEFKTQRFAQFAAEQNLKTVVLSRRWEKKIRRAVQFYQTALARESTAANKLQDFSRSFSEKKTIFVFGGFHAPQLKEMFREQGFSYVVLDPVITKISKKDQKLYRELMSGDKRLQTVPAALSRLSRVMSDFEWVASGLATITDVRREIARRALALTGQRAGRSEIRKDDYSDLKWSLGRERAEALKRFVKGSAEFKSRAFTISDLAASSLKREPPFAGITKKSTLNMALREALIKARPEIEEVSGRRNPRFYQLQKNSRSEVRNNEEGSAAFLHEVNRVMGRDVFKESVIAALSRKIGAMPLRPGEEALVLGPGAADYLPILLANLGLKVSTYDPSEIARDLQIALQNKFESTGDIHNLESEDDLRSRTYSHVFLLGVVNSAITRDYLKLIRNGGMEPASMVMQAKITGSMILFLALSRLKEDGLLYVNDYTGQSSQLMINIPKFVARAADQSRGSYLLEPSIDINNFTLSASHQEENQPGQRYGYVFRNKPIAAGARSEIRMNQDAAIWMETLRNAGDFQERLKAFQNIEDHWGEIEPDAREDAVLYALSDPNPGIRRGASGRLQMFRDPVAAVRQIIKSPPIYVGEGKDPRLEITVAADPRMARHLARAAVLFSFIGFSKMKQALVEELQSWDDASQESKLIDIYQGIPMGLSGIREAPLGGEEPLTILESLRLYEIWRQDNRRYATARLENSVLNKALSLTEYLSGPIDDILYAEADSEDDELDQYDLRISDIVFKTPVLSGSLRSEVRATPRGFIHYWKRQPSAVRLNLLQEVQISAAGHPEHAEAVQDLLMFALLDPHRVIRRAAVEINNWPGGQSKAPPLLLPIGLLQKHLESPAFSIDQFGLPAASDDMRDYNPSQALQNKRYSLLTLFFAAARDLAKLNSEKTAAQNGEVPSGAAGAWTSEQEARRVYSEEIVSMMLAAFQSEYRDVKVLDVTKIAAQIVTKYQDNPEYPLGSSQPLTFWEAVFLIIAQYQWYNDVLKKPDDLPYSFLQANYMNPVLKQPEFSEMLRLASEVARQIHEMAGATLPASEGNPLVQRSEVRSGIRRDYWILSSQGKAPEEMAAQIQSAGDTLKKAEIPWDQITPLLEEGFERLRARNAAPKDNWDRQYLPEKMIRLESALARLYRARDTQRIFVVDPIGHSKKDFALGYASEDSLYVTEGALALEPSVLAHYLLRVSELLETSSDSHFVFEIKDRNLPSLGDYRDKAIMDLAVIKEGRDLRREMEENLKDKAQDEGLYFVDQEDVRDNQDLGNFLLNQPQAVLYGNFLALSHLTAGRFKMTAPVILERERGLLGVWNVPESLKTWIAEALERAQRQTVRVSIFDLQGLWALKEAGYPEIDGLLDQLIRAAVDPEKKFTLNYPAFQAIFQTARTRLFENKAHSDDHQAWEQQRKETDVLVRVLLRFAGQDGLAHLFREILLAAPNQAADTLTLFETIFSLQHNGHEGFNWGAALWEAYLSPVNTAEETIFFRQRFDQARERHYEIAEKLPYWIFHVLEEPDAQRSARALDLFYDLPWNESMRGMIFDLIAQTSSGREKAAAFAYLNTLFFGTDVEKTYRMMGAEPDPVVRLLGPHFNAGEAYVLAMRDLRRATGTGDGSADGRLIWAARELDDGADVPGSRGHTWFSHYRESVHSAFRREQMATASGILEFLNTGDDVALKRDEYSLESSFVESVPASRIASYQRILRALLEQLQSQGHISDAQGSVFLNELINLPEEVILQSLAEANPDADTDDVYKVELFLRLYLAFSEKFGVVGFRMREDIKATRRSIGRWKMGSLKARFVKAYAGMSKAMDENKTVEAFTALTRVRELLRARLQSKAIAEPDPYDQDLQTFLELERVLRVLGYEWLPETVQSISIAIESGRWNEAARLTADAGRFIYSAGYGGSDLRDFLRELKQGSLSRTQLRDLVRALLNETRKAQKKTNTELRSALDYIRPRLNQLHDLTPEIKAKVKTVKEIKIHRYEDGQDEYEVDVIPEASRVEMENSAVDEFIRKSGLPLFEKLLTQWEEKLREPAVINQKAKTRKPRTVERLDDYFLRFGQPDSPARPKLLSLWSRKGLNLLRMARKGVEVPPGVIASAELTFQPDVRKSPEFKAKVLAEVERLRQFSRYPDLKLLIYARSGSAFMMPGLMMTIPNLGMNDSEAAELAQSTGDEWFAYDTYGELLRSFGINIFGIPEEEFQDVFDVYKKDEATGAQMKQAVDGYKQLLTKHGKTLPESLIDQVMLAMENVYGSWDSETAQRYRERHELSNDWGTVVILQKGIFGNLKAGEGNDISGVGAATLRDLPDGSESVQGKFRIRAIGEQLMTRAENYRLLGRSQRIAEEVTFEDQYPELYRQLTEQAQKLKQLFGYTQLFEFVIERGHLWVTQSNDDYQADDFPEIEETTAEPLGRGHGVSGGAVRGWAATTLESAKTLLERYLQEKPEGVDGVILLVDRVNPEFVSEIPPGVHLIAKTLSIHAETLAQTNGIAAVYGVNGMERDDAGAWKIGDQKIVNGDVLTMDGHENPLVYHDSGKIFLGSLPLKNDLPPQNSGGRSEVRSGTTEPAEPSSKVIVLPGGRYGQQDHGDEMLDVYDSDGNKIGTRARQAAHEAGEWHAVAHVYIFDSEGRLVLQKRAAALKQSPGALQASVSGHVMAGQTPEETALREGEEELGVVLDPKKLRAVTVVKNNYKYDSAHEWENREFVYVYIYQASDAEIGAMQQNYNLHEIETLQLAETDFIKKMLDQNPNMFSNSLTGIIRDRTELWASMTQTASDQARNEKKVRPRSVLAQKEEELKALESYLRFAELPLAKIKFARQIGLYLHYDNPAIRARAYQALRGIPNIQQVILDSLTQDSASDSSPLLLALSFMLKKDELTKGSRVNYENLETTQRLFEIAEEKLLSRDLTAGSRRMMLQALGYLHHPKAADLYVSLLEKDRREGKELDSFIFESAAFSDVANRRQKILGWFLETQKDILAGKIPFGITFFMDAPWIAEHLGHDSGWKLANRFGYMDMELLMQLWKKRDLLVSDEKDVKEPPSAEKQEALRLVEASRFLIREMGMASANMVSRYLESEESERHDLLIGWRQLQSKMLRMLTHETPDQVRPLWSVSVESGQEGQIERDLFFGALKQIDWANSIDKHETQPFGYESKEKHGGRYHYASFDLFKSQFDEKIKKASDVFGTEISEELRTVLTPFWAGDAMSVETETLLEPREEARARTIGRWRALAGLLEVRDGLLALKSDIAKRVAMEAEMPDQKLSVPLSDQAAVASFISVLAAKRTVWKYALLDPAAMSLANLFIQKIQRDPDWKALSFGSRSALKLLAYDLLRDTSRTKEQIWPEWDARFRVLSNEEKNARGALPSLGMELQSVNVPSAQVYLWKQALPFFDIPSPERLRYGHIVETAFRPAWTSSAFLMAIPILHRMGLLGGDKYKRAAAFHISLAGDLGPEARWIAFPLMMFGREIKDADEELSVEEKAAQSSWVLSKGYIHLNKENQKADTESDAPEFHTEIRTARLANIQKGQAELIRDYEQFLPAIQFLGAALAAFKKEHVPNTALSEKETALADLWSRYQAELAAIVHEIPEAQNLLDADWYESTGDSKDAQLTGDLKIFKLMGELYAYKQQHPETYPDFTERVKKLFLNYAEQGSVIVRSEVRHGEVLTREEQQKKLAHFLWEAAGAEPNQPLHWQEHIWDLAGALIDSGLFRDVDLTSDGVQQLAHFIWLAKSGPGRAIHQDEEGQISDWVQAHSFVNTTLRPWRDKISPAEPGHVGWSTDTLSGDTGEDQITAETNLASMGLHIYQINHQHAEVGGDFYRAVQSENHRFALVELADGTDHGENAMQASWFAQAVQEAEAELGAPLLSILAENGGPAVFERVREYLNTLQNKIDVITETKRGGDHFGFYTYNLVFVDHETGLVHEWRAGHHPAVVEVARRGEKRTWRQEARESEVLGERKLGDSLLPLGWMLNGVSSEAVRGSAWQYVHAKRMILYTDGAWAPSKEEYGLLGLVSQPGMRDQSTPELFEKLQSKIENVRELGTGIAHDDVTFILFDLEKGKEEYEKFKSRRSEVRNQDSSLPPMWAENRRPAFPIKPEQILIYHKPVGETIDRKSAVGLWKNLPIEDRNADILTPLRSDQEGIVVLTTNSMLAERLDSGTGRPDLKVTFEVRLKRPASELQLELLRQGPRIWIQSRRGRVKPYVIKFQGVELANPTRSLLRVTMHQNESRLLQRALESAGLIPVTVIRRKVLGIEMNGLAQGHFKRASWQDLLTLLQETNMEESELSLVTSMYAKAIEEEKEDQSIIRGMLRSTDFVSQVFERIFARPDIPENLSNTDQRVLVKDIRHIGEGGFKRVYRVGLRVPGETTDFGFIVKVVKSDVVKSDSEHAYDYKFLEGVAEAVTRLREQALYLHPPATDFLMIRDSHGRDRMVSAESEVLPTQAMLTDGQRDKIILRSYFTMYKILDEQFVFDPKRANTVVTRIGRQQHVATLIDLDNLHLGRVGAYAVVQSMLDFGFKSNDIISEAIQVLGEEKGNQFLGSAIFVLQSMGLTREFREAFEKYKKAPRKNAGTASVERKKVINVTVNGLEMRVPEQTTVYELLLDYKAHFPTAVVYLNGTLLSPEGVRFAGAGRKAHQFYDRPMSEGDALRFIPRYQAAGKVQSFDEKRRVVDDLKIRTRDRFFRQGGQSLLQTWLVTLIRLRQGLSQDQVRQGFILKSLLRDLDSVERETTAYLDPSRTPSLAFPLSAEELDRMYHRLERLDFIREKRSETLRQWKSHFAEARELIKLFNSAASRSEVRGAFPNAKPHSDKKSIQRKDFQSWGNALWVAFFMGIGIAADFYFFEALTQNLQQGFSRPVSLFGWAAVGWVLLHANIGLLVLGFLGVYTVFGLDAEKILRQMPEDGVSNRVEGMFRRSLPWKPYLLMIVSVPHEEVLFTGALLPFLATQMGRPLTILGQHPFSMDWPVLGAMALTSTAFSLIHRRQTSLTFISRMLFSWTMMLLYSWTGSIAAPMMTHLLFDLRAFRKIQNTARTKTDIESLRVRSEIRPTPTDRMTLKQIGASQTHEMRSLSEHHGRLFLSAAARKSTSGGLARSEVRMAHASMDDFERVLRYEWADSGLGFIDKELLGQEILKDGLDRKLIYRWGYLAAVTPSGERTSLRTLRLVRVGDFLFADSRIRNELESILNKYPLARNLDILYLDQLKSSLTEIETGHDEWAAPMILAVSGLNLKGAHVLDLGAGDGILSVIAREKGAETVQLVDMDVRASSRLAKHIKANNMTPDAFDYYHGDIADRPKVLARFSGKSQVDVVFANIGEHPIYPKGTHLRAIEYLDDLPEVRVFVAGGYAPGQEVSNMEQAYQEMVRALNQRGFYEAVRYSNQYSQSPEGLGPKTAIVFVRRGTALENVLNLEALKSVVRSEIRREVPVRQRDHQEQPEFRKVMLSYRDLAENFTGKNKKRLEELAVLAVRYPQIRFTIYDANLEDSHYFEIRKSFQGVVNIKFQTQTGAVALSPSHSEVENDTPSVLHLSTQFFDTRHRFGAHAKKIKFMVAGRRRGSLAAALLYNPEHWLYRAQMAKQGDFWVVQSAWARLGRQWLAGFVVATAA